MQQTAPTANTTLVRLCKARISSLPSPLFSRRQCRLPTICCTLQNCKDDESKSIYLQQLDQKDPAQRFTSAPPSYSPFSCACVTLLGTHTAFSSSVRQSGTCHIFGNGLMQLRGDREL